MITKFKFTPQGALSVGTQFHIAPEAFGKVLSRTEPRMAVAYHFCNDFDMTREGTTSIGLPTGCRGRRR